MFVRFRYREFSNLNGEHPIINISNWIVFVLVLNSGTQNMDTGL